MQHRSRRRTTVALVLLAATAAVGCSKSTDSGDGVASLDDTGSASTTSTTVDPQDAQLEFAECMRENGMPDFPDPDSGGGPVMVGPGNEIDPNDPAFQDANQACASKLGNGAGGTLDPAGSQEIQEQLLAMAECMRDQGFDLPDPSFDGGVGQMQLPDGVDPSDPKFQEAQESCRTSAGLPSPGVQP